MKSGNINIHAQLIVTLLFAVFSYSLVIDFVSLVSETVKLELCESDMEESDESEKEEKEESKKEEKIQRDALSLNVPLFARQNRIQQSKIEIHQSPFITINTPPPKLKA